ncbi:MAG: Rubrerythrin [Firmicutes bacterium ADurb.Bin373]|nr:MAG: Rubrerythrin [Firmicutes bacterium ADurb.Bin373]
MNYHQPPGSGIPNGNTAFKIQTPQLPLLGPNDFGRLLRNIYDSIVDEATAAEFYSRLLREAPDSLHREFIQHAYQDELEHLDAFTRLYRHFTGQSPRYIIQPIQYRTYKEGILMALKGELEAGGFYRDVQLSTTDQLVRDTFYLAMVDELEHATQFGVLYNTL